ncbi:major facilitator superfamily domain-containing protein [Lipomyces oligophaga]|uniref:major facilitator superfamily domain-containing protein n=1 Tax=Lipomyces oligophaga TaxID=45792 RepID=UPI0034CF6B3D
MVTLEFDDGDDGNNSFVMREKLGDEEGSMNQPLPMKVIKDDDHLYPDGGKEAWVVVFGSFCAMFASFGIWNSMGVFQAWLVENSLQNYSEGTVSWIFSVYTFLFFLGGVQVGPIFDKYGVRALVTAGTLGFGIALMMFSLSKEYYQFFLSYAILGGISCSLIFTPSVAVIGQWFDKRRGIATGIATTGGSFGGIIFPLMLRSLVPKIGFAWSVRIVGFFELFFGLLSVFCLKSRIRGGAGSSAMIDLKAFLDVKFATLAVGNFMIELALQIPPTYFITYAVSKGMERYFCYALIAIMNASSVFGRFLPGYGADRFGVFNMVIVTLFLCAAFNLGIWVPIAHLDGRSMGGAIVYMVLFGFSSGSGISLTPVCFSKTCKIEDYGKRYGTAYSLAAVASLIGIPIAGAILDRMDGNYAGLAAFCGASYLVGTILFAISRGLYVGWSIKAIY